jgi:antitoxin component YwqK of YwqJK toxin-antitoxin module
MNSNWSLIFLMLFNYSFAQNAINQFDSNGKRHGLWTKTYENGSIRYKGEFEHGKEIGVFQFFTEENSKTPDCIKEFSRTNDKATVSYFYQDGKLKSKGQMEGTLRIGKWIYYFKDGIKVLSEENYINGLLEGDYKIFYLNGKVTEWSLYKNGLLHSTSKRFSEEGILVEAINYEEGKLNGEALYYNNSGDLILKGNYLNDISIGAWESYENGKLIETTFPNKKQ